jgi:hypothetical protein
MWIANRTSNNIIRLRADGENPGPFHAGQNPSGIAFDGANIWVANRNDGTLSKL